MRTLLLSTVAFAALAGSAFAADLPSRKEAPVYIAPTPVFSWTGFYIGADVGGSFGSTSIHNNFTDWTSRSLDTSGVLGGGYVGYNYQVNQNFVLGVEGDFQGTSNNNSLTWTDSLSGSAFTLKNEQNWLASINGRVGIAYDRALFYAIGGAAWAQGKSTLAGVDVTGASFAVFSNDKTLNGWDVGAGVEYAFTPNWVGRVEYRYYDFGSQNWTDGAGDWLNQRTQINTVRVGLAYLFGAPAPVVAKY